MIAGFLKKFFIYLLITSGLLVFTACSVRRENSQKEITIWTLQMGDFADYMYKVIRHYEAEHPNLHIKWVDVPFSEGEKRTLAAIMSDNPPDLINLNPDFSALLSQKGTLEEIPLENVTNFNQALIQSLMYEDKLYSIPWYATSAITIYNKNLYEKSGLVRLPKTYKELATVSLKIKETTGAYAYLPTITENDTMLKILNKYGISRPEDYTTPQALEVFNMFKTMYQDGTIPPETISVTHREALEQYMAGKIIFYQGGANFLNMIKENAPTVYNQTDVTEQITGPIGQYDISVMNFVIPKRAKMKKEALDFCLYLTNTDNQLELAKITNIIATDSEALKDEFYNDNSDLISKARSISARQLNNISPQLKQRRNQKEYNNLINSSVQEVLLNKANTDIVLARIARIMAELEEQ